MRLSIAALVVCLLTAAAAQARESLPKIKIGTPYEAARTQLMKSGYVPAQLLSRGGFCGPDSFPCGDNLVRSSTPSEYSEYLFIRRRDEAIFLVSTEPLQGRDGHFAIGFTGIWRAPRATLQNYEVVLVTPSGKKRAFARPPAAAQPEPPTPLCSETGGRMPCWIKPPPDYRPSHR